MDAPRCRTCGERHWSRVCVTEAVTKPVTKPVTPVVTKNVTDARDAEIARLRAEVLSLKRQLAEKPKSAMTGAERMRRLREKRTSQAGR